MSYERVSVAEDWVRVREAAGVLLSHPWEDSSVEMMNRREDVPSVQNARSLDP